MFSANGCYIGCIFDSVLMTFDDGYVIFDISRILKRNHEKTYTKMRKLFIIKETASIDSQNF